MTWWKYGIIALIVLAVGAITAQGLKDRPPPATEVMLGKAKTGGIVRTIAGAGKVQAATTVKISSNLSGDLLELLVKEGDVVTKGQVLGRIDRKRYEANLRQAQAAYNAAKSDMATAQIDVDRAAMEMERSKNLVDKGIASKAEYEKASSDLQSAKARVTALGDRASQAQASVEEQQNNLAKTVLLSPINGTVIERSREIGERVRGSDFSEDVVMTLAALATMEVKIEVGEHEVVHLQNGQKSTVKIDALEGQAFEGTVFEIAQKALVRNPGTEQETTSFPVTVALNAPPKGVLPGMSAEVRIVAEERQNAVIVPVQAVTVRPSKSLPDAKVDIEGKGLKAQTPGEQFAKVVFTVDGDKKVHVRRVTTGIASDSDIEIVDGLKDGEQIVEGPYRTLSKDLKDGDTIEDLNAGDDGKGGPHGPSKG